MALNYFKSKDVRVFPSSFRGTFNETISFDPESRLNTEANFIAPKISGNKASYIVDYTKTEEVITSIKFVLGGYYFEIKNLNSYSLNDSYLHIKLRNIKIADNQQADNKDSERITTVLGPWETNTDNILDYLDTENKISYFTGLKISEENTDSNAAASIKLLDADGNINQEAILVDLDHGKGANTLLHGVGLKADSENQTVFGTYNDNKTTTLFEIGKGSANDTRANALEISTDTTVVNNPTININGETITVDGDTLINLKGATKIDGTTNVWGNLGIHDEDQSNSTTTGAVVISGGVGIGKNLNVGGDTNLNDNLIVKTSPTDDETNVEIDGTLNITDDTTIASNITITSTETTLTKPLEITDTTANALKVSGDVTLSKDLSVGATDSEVLVVKASPESGKANVEITGTLSSSDKATFKNGLEVASGKTTTLGGQVNITGAVNINTASTENPGATTIYGATTITGATAITGAVTITGKATSTATATTDGSTTLTTKGYVDGKFDALDVASVGEDGKYLKTISEANGIITATAQTFDTTISSTSGNTNAPTSKAVNDLITSKLTDLKADKVGGSVEVTTGGKTVTDFHFIDSITQTNGIVTATAQTLTTSLTEAISTHQGIASAKTTKEYVDKKAQDLDTKITNLGIDAINNSLKSKNLVFDGSGSYKIVTTDLDIGKKEWYTLTVGNNIEAFAITSLPVDATVGGVPDRDGPVNFSSKDDDDTALSHMGWNNNIYAYKNGKNLYILNANYYFKAKVHVVLILSI